MLENVSIKLTDYLSGKKNLSEIERLKMIFGFQNLLHQAVQSFGILMAAACLHIFKETVLFYTIFALYRGIAGGYHLSTSLGCNIVTASIIIGGTQIALNINLSIVMIFVIFTGVVLVVLFCAPRRSANYPVSEKQHRRLKIQSLVIVILYLIISVLCTNVIRAIVTIAAVAETVTLIPKIKVH